MKLALPPALASCIVLATAGLSAQAPAPERPRTGHDIEVRVVGCVAGSVLTEVEAARPDRETEAPAETETHVRRWRLRLTPDLQKALRKAGKRRVEIVGIADRREMARAELAAERRVARPGVTGPAASAAMRAGTRQAPPTLYVDAITPQAVTCR
ncbi:MAG: hypothetical protein AB7O67_11520 [Vicinamibacterales bacterium]